MPFLSSGPYSLFCCAAVCVSRRFLIFTKHRARHLTTTAMHEYEAIQALQDLPESTCTTPLKPSMVATGFATDHPRKSQNSATDAATSIGFTAPVPSWRHPAPPNGGKEPLAGMATHSRNDFLLVDSCAGICPKIMIGPSTRSVFLFLHHDPIQHTKTSPANTIAELEEDQTVFPALKGTTATNSALFWGEPLTVPELALVPVAKEITAVTPPVKKEILVPGHRRRLQRRAKGGGLLNLPYQVVLGLAAEVLRGCSLPCH